MKDKKEKESIPETTGMVNDTAITVYKWLKIVQSLILICLGAMFIVCAYLSDGLNNALPICLGIVFSAYGLIEIMAGYYLRRSIVGEEILFGGLSICFAVVLFINGDFLRNIISDFMVAMFIFYAIMLIVFGVDRILGKNPVQKSMPKAVLSFIGAAVLVVLDAIYLFLRSNDGTKDQLEKWMIIIVGGLMIVIGIIAMFSLLIKLKNTKKMMDIPAKKENPDKEEVLDVEYNDKKADHEVIEATVAEVKDTPNLIEDKPIAIENKENKHKKDKK